MSNDALRLAADSPVLVYVDVDVDVAVAAVLRGSSVD